MKPWPQVDFGKLVQEVTQLQCGPADLSIWGGRCAESGMLEFLQGWDLTELPWRICEYASEIVFEQSTIPQTTALLERARLFGPGGDLELRRDGTIFRWRFIGSAGVQPTAGNYNMQNYWTSHSETVFHQHEEKALLWGERGNGQWTEKRVGAAKLNYPVPADWRRVQISYRTFSRNGHVEFVWFTRLSEYKEADNGS